MHFAFLVFFLSNLKELSRGFNDVDAALMPQFNYSDPKSVAPKDYSAWFKQYGAVVPGNVTDCDLETEMQKVNFMFLRLVSVCSHA